MHTASFFSKHQRLLAVLVLLYVASALLAHLLLPSIFIWMLAVFFLVAMTGTYVLEALMTGHSQKLEICVALGLIAVALLSLFGSPIWVICALFGHGVWDLAKHRGAGVPFLSWYTLSCAAFDFTYGALLFASWKVF